MVKTKSAHITFLSAKQIFLNSIIYNYINNEIYRKK